MNNVEHRFLQVILNEGYFVAAIYFFLSLTSSFSMA